MKISNYNHQFLRSVIICSCALIARCDDRQNVKSKVPKEILDIFNKTGETHVAKSETLPAGSVSNGDKIFAEGSSMTLKDQSHETSNDVMHKSSSTTQPPTTSGSKSVTQSLNITTLDFLSGSDELSHSNGTSSIKARKGVHFSKIVPKKGVNFEDFMNYSLPMEHSCFVFNQTNCYDVDYYKNLVCSCCETSNELGRMISRQPLTNCSNCTPVNKFPVDLSQPCSGICCENITLGATVKTSTVKIETSSNKNVKDYQVFESENDNNKFSKLSNKTNEKDHIKKKLKPTVTNVPYDSDISNAFSKSKGEKYVPIIVSIFVIPMAGILIFLVWKKTRELWDRRYYRRMDFLIDGMYNE